MDNQGNTGYGTSGMGSAASSAKEKVSDAANIAKEKMSDAAAGAKDQLAEVGRKATEKYNEAADYVRNIDFGTMTEDVQDLVRRYPVYSLAIAAGVGFLVARAMSRHD
jgi:ElaB/YqjD/DUF883 family membrane-anchored ribosome-binding protein